MKNLNMLSKNIRWPYKGILLYAFVTAFFCQSVSAAPFNDHVQHADILESYTDPSTGIHYEPEALGNNLDASVELGEPAHDGTPAKRSVWYKWVADSDQAVTIYTIGSNFDTRLAVYTSAGLQTGAAVVSNDDAGSAYTTSSVDFTPTQGLTYYIAVDGFAPSLGDAAMGHIYIRLTRASGYILGEVRIPFAHAEDSAEPYWVSLISSGQDRDHVFAWFEKGRMVQKYRIPLRNNLPAIVKAQANCEFCSHNYLPTFHGIPTEAYYESEALELLTSQSYASIDIDMLVGGSQISGTLSLPAGELNTNPIYVLSAANIAKSPADTQFHKQAIVGSSRQAPYFVSLPGGSAEFHLKAECRNGCSDLQKSFYVGFKNGSYQAVESAAEAFVFDSTILGFSGVDIELKSNGGICFPIRSKPGKASLICL